MRTIIARFPTWALWLCALITFVAAVLLILAIILGVRAGQQQLEIKRRQQVGLALQRALEYHAEGALPSAQTAYEAVLILDPNNSAALEGLAHIRQIGIVSPTRAAGLTTTVAITSPAAVAALTTQPTVTVALPLTAAQLTPTSAVTASQLMTQAEAAYAAGRWSESVNVLQEIRRLNPVYENQRVTELLFDAYINLATEKDNQNKLEEALALYEEALVLQPNAAEIRKEHQLIAEYLEVLTYRNINWERSITLLRTLYAQEPDYRDIQDRLQEALVAYGEERSEEAAPCDAADLLTEAITLAVTPGIIAQRDQYKAACDSGTTLATGSATAGITVTGTVTKPGQIPTAAKTVEAEEAAPSTTDTTSNDDAASDNAASGGALSRGYILYSAVDATNGRSRIMRQGVGSAALTNAPATASATVMREDASQPAMRQDGQRLLFHNMRDDMAGLSAWDPATDLLLRFTNYAEDSLPTWSPQGNRLAFASNREGDRIWRIYTTWADGNGDATVLSIGEAPDWHPAQDTIVFRGCDDTGNRCGLWTINGSGGNRTPLTTVSADNRPTWSPDGRYVVFMSDGRDGNFELYRVDTATEQVLRLTTAPANDGLPAVSPDGRWVAFVSNREGGWKLWAVPIGGGAATVIAPIAGNLDNWLNQDLQWIE